MKKSLLALVPLALALLAAAPASGAGPGRSIVALVGLRHPAGLERFVHAVSDPRSPSYRQYESVEELARRFGASPPDRREAVRWLRARGAAVQVSPTGAFLVARLRPAPAAQIFPRATASAVAGPGLAGSRLVPSGLRGAVTGVAFLPTAPGAFGRNAEIASSRLAEAPSLKGTSIVANTGTPAGCAAGKAAGLKAPFSGFTPNEYLDAYGLSTLHEGGFRGGGKTVALIEIDGFKRADIVAFAKCFGRKAPPTTVTPVTTKRPLAPGLETTLDLEVLSAATPKLKHAYVYESGGSEVGLLLSVAASLSNPATRPNAISMSLGQCEPSLFAKLALRDSLDNLFATAAGAGITTVVAAGDQGSSSCKVELEDGSTTALPLISASDPASSEFVTAVGGTNFKLSRKNRIKSEAVWNDAPLEFAGGGGAVSILTTPRPWWQRRLGEGAGNGRLLPDVSGLADLVPGYAIYCTAAECRSEDQPKGGWTAIGGTSAATPLYAGGVLLADGYQAKRGVPPLGFVNPLIYSIGRSKGSVAGANPGRILRDVVHGNDDLGILTPEDAGGGHPLGCCKAFKGYDVASGWGSINLPGLAHVGVRAAKRAQPLG